MAIQVLSEQLASQIAAGEVVERPFSVVKELVENALDAGARTIHIDIRQGGRQLIQVADDGSGIDAAEIELAFRRHATSKLTSVEELNAIRTLGFRGEALAAIAAVSRLTVVSRTADAKAGVRLVLEAGKPAASDQVGAPQGTVIAVENLFYNVPARLKFLKSVNAERRLIDEFVTRYALAYPEVRFRLTHDGRLTFQTTGSDSVRDVLLAIYGPDTARQLLEIGSSESDEDPTDDDALFAVPNPAAAAHAVEDASPAGVTVSGFVGPPSLHWANRSHITLFVNGRWIRDNSITYAVIQAYHTLLPVGRYPLGLIFIQMPPAQVDVNVHPAKTEVRFRYSNTVFGAVQRAVREKLVAESPVRSMGNRALGSTPEAAMPGWSTGQLDQQAFGRRDTDDQHELGLDWSQSFDQRPVSGVDANGLPHTTPQPTLGGERLPIMRVVGQVGAAYIITEGPDGMYLIDQHAAHERVLYEQFMAQWDNDQIASQGLVAGTAVHMTPSQASLVDEYMEVLTRLGFKLEPFGPNAYMMRGVPAIAGRLDPAQALISVVEDLERGDAPLQGRIEARIVLRVCKSAAVKAGQALSGAEMEALVQQLERCQSPHTCPHGRPTLIHLSVAQLARQFGRS